MLSNQILLTSIRVRFTENFHQALAGARRDSLLGRLVGRDTALQPFPSTLKWMYPNRRPFKLQEVPVKGIVGSMNRAMDFDYKFRPLRESIRDRWIDVCLAHEYNGGWEAIVVHKIGGEYFVEDGHHRVSVARELGMEFILAGGWEYSTGTKPRDSNVPMQSRLRITY